MEKEGVTLRNAPDGGAWSGYFKAKSHEMDQILEPLLNRIAEKGGGLDLPLDRKEFLAALDALDRVYGDGDRTGQKGMDRVNARLQSALENAHQHSTGAAKKLSLSLLRKSRMFGLQLVNYHLRETAEEYE